MTTFDRQIESQGWFLLPAAVPMPLVEWMRDDMTAARSMCHNIQRKNGISEGMEGTVHHLPALGESWLEFLEKNPAAPYIERFFGGKYVLNSFGGSANPARSQSYAHAIHRDMRSFSGPLRLMFNTIVFLDDFTAENGATWLMNGGHTLEERPSEEEFKRSAFQIIAPAGSIAMWNANLWHRGGNNCTDKQRRSVTPIFARPFMRPEFDYPRALGYENGGLYPPALRQVLGFNSRVPASLHEFYQPAIRRFYQPDQG